MDAGHDHGTVSASYRPRLLIVLVITLAVVLLQVVAGLASGSLALLADAGHALTDATGLALALGASWLAGRPPTPTRTFGMQRAEVLAALANVLLLTAVAVWVVIEAIRRWDDPATIESGLMIGAAAVGAAANLVCLLILRSGKQKSLNVRGAYLEVLGDLLGSLAVIVAGVVIATTDFERADVIASLVIAAMIAPRVWRLFRDVADVLLEATPRNVNLAHVREHITEIPGVVDVHDLHAWTITSGVPVLSAHVVVEDECLAQGRSGEVLDRLGECLAGHFDVEHCTFQLEPVGHQSHESSHHQ